MTQLRRQQLHDLAKAYGVEVTPDGSKDEILPAMVAAEKRGVFRSHAARPYYLEKAMRDPDRPAVPLHNPEMDVPKEAKPDDPKLEIKPDVEKKERKPSAYNMLQKEAKALGLNGWGMKKEALQKAVNDENNRRRQTGN